MRVTVKVFALLFVLLCAVVAVLGAPRELKNSGKRLRSITRCIDPSSSIESVTWIWRLFIVEVFDPLEPTYGRSCQQNQGECMSWCNERVRTRSNNCPSNMFCCVLVNWRWRIVCESFVFVPSKAVIFLFKLNFIFVFRNKMIEKWKKTVWLHDRC